MIYYKKKLHFVAWQRTQEKIQAVGNKRSGNKPDIYRYEIKVQQNGNQK